MEGTMKPTAILIVHGAYFLPAAWTPFMDDLIQAGFTVRCPRLPTCGDERPPKALLEDDVKVVRQAATELIEQGHKILVLAHSYGGVVTTEAINPSFYAEGTTHPNSAGVVSLAYLAAFLVQPGDTVVGAMSKHIPSGEVDLEINDDGTAFAKNAPTSFYNDIESARAEELAQNNVTHNSGAVLTLTIRSAPWKSLPTTYIHCMRDKALVFPLQQILVEEALATSRSATFDRAFIDSGHCPFISRPNELLQIIKKIAGGCN
ncbi:Alpha/beta hydrolase fold-1 [Talaromyces proteolyticus]|uniref:Alpha/beta hydrolase fold-1 n=1 Tax=Talaromyces proteolyticus TaxID=1131652 RepID=A0AAD4KZT1_9EURO|nr:Alpha/beta hydrolase fold-1 [Talaromyces proteolyticus]KAH8703628.1 Alpha/beta hydrolase fold-1 [Talaromyces proteolyticus]